MSLPDRLPDIRRIVTGDDVNGVSRIVEDAPAAQIDERTLELIYSKNGGAQA